MAMEPFLNWRMQAEMHWKEFQPKRYAALKKAGMLEKALLEAADTTARAKLLVAFLEMGAFGQPPETTPQRAN